MTKDLTQGQPAKIIIGFALPVFFGMLFQQFYSLVDTMIVGNFLGASVLAAVGSTGSINFLILGFCNGLCAGFAMPVAREFGAKRLDKMRQFVANGAWLCMIFAVIMTALTVLFCRQILEAMGTPKDIIEDAYRYIVIIFAGIPVTFLYNMLSGILRSVGDSKTPVIFLALASIINIVLDIVFIGFLHTGVEGAGIATVISQAVSGFLCLRLIKKRFDILKLSKEEWQWNGEKVLGLLRDGLPMGVQYSITAIGSVILQTAVNGLGTVAVAASTAAVKLSIFCCAPFDALGSTMATYGGQNIGAGKIERIGKGLRAAIIIGFIYSALVFVVLFMCSGSLLLLFVKAEEVAIIENARLYLLINAAAYLLLTLVNMLRFMIQGLGYGHFAMLAGVFEMIARVIAGLFMVPKLGYLGVCLASPLAWLLADAFLIPAYFYCMHKSKMLIKGKQKVLREVVEE